MTSGIFSIGISALQNAQLGLTTAGHNIANANTAGYNRQRIIQVSNIATLTGSGYVGTGARVSTIERIYDNFLAKQVTSAQTSLSALDVHSSVLSEINMLLSDSDAGLASALEGFFTGINQLSADPTSLTARQTMVSSAQSMVSRFTTLSSQLAERYESVNGRIQSYVGSINSFGQQIAQVNRQIITAEAKGIQPPNDLYDQRDQLIAELNKVVGVQTTINNNGSLNVFFGNGQPLVIGTTAMSLAATPSSSDPKRLTVGLVSLNGVQELPESLISGGELAGILQFRSQSLDVAANSLGQIAASVALAFNAQHALGQDLLGHIDGDAAFVADFFKLTPPSIVANTNNPAGTATLTASYQMPQTNADGTFYTNLTASDYRLDYDGTNFTLTRVSDNVSWSDTSLANLNATIDASPQGPQGFELAASGTFAAGSSYLIQPTRNAARNIAVNPTLAVDVRQIAAAAPVLAQTGPSNTGSASISAGSVATGYIAPPPGAPVTLTHNGGNMTGFPAASDVTVTLDGVATTYPAGTPVPYTNGATYAFDGISFSIVGSPRDGDTFVIGRNANGVSDNRNALLMGQMQTGKTMAGSTASFSTAYAQMVSNAGNKGAELNTIFAAQQTVLAEAEKARDAVSGVNLDEEAVHLIQYQESYQAAAKMLQIASQLFDSILAIR